MKARIRELLRATPFQSFIIRMADGKEYRIDHPDFVLAASSDVPQITIEEPDGSMHFLSALLVTSVERVAGSAHPQRDINEPPAGSQVEAKLEPPDLRTHLRRSVVPRYDVSNTLTTRAKRSADPIMIGIARKFHSRNPSRIC